MNTSRSEIGTIIFFMSHDHSRSWSLIMEKYDPRSFILNPQKYEPRSLMSDRRSFPITIKKISELKIAFLGPKFPIISSEIFSGGTIWFFFYSQGQEWGKIYWVRISKGNYPKKHISNGQFWWLSRDQPWSAIIYVHWQNHEPRSLTIMIAGIKKIWATITHDRQMIVNDCRSFMIILSLAT